MANAKQCDRCKIFYTRKTNPDLTIGRYIHGYGAAPIDLCDGCIQDLEKFLENGQVSELKKGDENV